MQIFLQLGIPDDEKLSLLKENQILIGALNPYLNKEKISNLIKKNKKLCIRVIAQNHPSAIYGYSFVSSKFIWL